VQDSITLAIRPQRLQRCKRLHRGLPLCGRQRLEVHLRKRSHGHPAGGARELAALLDPERMAQAEFVASNSGRTDEGHWRMLWNHEIGELPSHRESRFWLATGLLLPVWDRLPAENMRVRRLTSDDGDSGPARHFAHLCLPQPRVGFFDPRSQRPAPVALWTRHQKPHAIPVLLPLGRWRRILRLPRTQSRD